jgi:hypothetical protein
MGSTESPAADRFQTLVHCVVLRDPPYDTCFGQRSHCDVHGSRGCEHLESQKDAQDWLSHWQQRA